jgi:hypothetical protein
LIQTSGTVGLLSVQLSQVILSGDPDINISKRFSKMQEDGLEDSIVGLDPFSLGPVDDEAPNGMLWSSFSYSFFYIISCSDSHSYMIALLNGHHSFSHST